MNIKTLFFWMASSISLLLTPVAFAEYQPSQADAQLIVQVADMIWNVASKDGGHKRLYKIHQKLWGVIWLYASNERYSFILTSVDEIIWQVFGLEGGSDPQQNQYGVFGVSPHTNSFYKLDQHMYIMDSVFVWSQPVAVTLEGKYAYVANKWSTFVAKVDVTNMNVVDEYNVGYNPFDIAVIGDNLYVTHFGDGREDLAIFSMTSGDLLENNHQNTNQYSNTGRTLIGADPATKKIYLAPMSSSPANITRHGTNELGQTITIDESDHGDLWSWAKFLQVSKDGSKIFYLTSTKALQIVDSNSLTHIAQIEVENFPTDAAIDENENYAYVIDRDDFVYKINLRNYTVEGVVDGSIPEELQRNRWINERVYLGEIAYISDRVYVWLAIGHPTNRQIIGYYPIDAHEFE